ncbi:hypothetical protein AN958_12657 [Leucoagaricus sp. SymC.cos]|nr:hypothetical protein AN958_12657 [Leucoagaricus sp. SymC.cos]
MEILFFISSPKDLLAVARTCKALCAQLLSPAATYVWRDLLERVGLPHPDRYCFSIDEESEGDGNGGVVTTIWINPFVRRWSAYAAFVFDGGVCEYCGEKTENMYYSFSIRLRLCGKRSCIQGISSSRLIWKYDHEAADSYTSLHDYVWFSQPVMEIGTIVAETNGRDNFEKFAEQNWFTGGFTAKRSRIGLPDEMLTRLGLVEEPRPLGTEDDYEEDARLYGYLGGSESQRVTKPSNRLRVAKKKNEMWMLSLRQWRARWINQGIEVKKHNNGMGRILAKPEDWKYSDVMNHLDRLRPIVAQELHEFHVKQDHRTIMRLQKENLDQLWKYYQKLMSQRCYSFGLPSFPVFLALPAVQILQSRELMEAKVSIKAALVKNGAIERMLEHQLKSWESRAYSDLFKKFDPSGTLMEVWKTQRATTKAQHPLNRPDVLWKCKVCDSVDTDQMVYECLDSRAVLRHQCKEKGGKKKKGITSQPWSIDNFVRDEQVREQLA